MVICELHRKQPPEGTGVSEDEASLFLSVKKWARAPKVSVLWEQPSGPSQSHRQEPFWILHNTFSSYSATNLFFRCSLFLFLSSLDILSSGHLKDTQWKEVVINALSYQCSLYCPVTLQHLLTWWHTGLTSGYQQQLLLSSEPFWTLSWSLLSNN